MSAPTVASALTEEQVACLTKFCPSFETCRFVRAIDGDTIDVAAPATEREWEDEEARLFIWRLRLLRVNTPELRSRDEAEKRKAQHAKDVVEMLCQQSECLKVKIEGQDSFGRALAEIHVLRECQACKYSPLPKGYSINQFLLRSGLAETFMPKRSSSKKNQ